jgi:hypothetical protein
VLTLGAGSVWQAVDRLLALLHRSNPVEAAVRS